MKLHCVDVLGSLVFKYQLDLYYISNKHSTFMSPCPNIAYCTGLMQLKIIPWNAAIKDLFKILRFYIWPYRIGIVIQTELRLRWAQMPEWFYHIPFPNGGPRFESREGRDIGNWTVPRTVTDFRGFPVADLGGMSGAPPWDPILSFLHTFSLKSACIGGPCPSNGSTPRYGKSWIRHCFLGFTNHYWRFIHMKHVHTH